MQTSKSGGEKETLAIDGAWWTVAHNPNLGEIDGGENQEPV